MSEFEFVDFCTRTHRMLLDYTDYVVGLRRLGVDIDVEKVDYIGRALDVICDLIAASMSHAYGVKPETVKKTLANHFFSEEWYYQDSEDVELPNYRAVFRCLTGDISRPRRAA